MRATLANGPTGAITARLDAAIASGDAKPAEHGAASSWSRVPT